MLLRAHEPGVEERVLPLSPREARAGRDLERGASKINFLLSPTLSSLLRREEREKHKRLASGRALHSTDRLFPYSPCASRQLECRHEVDSLVRPRRAALRIPGFVLRAFRRRRSSQ